MSLKPCLECDHLCSEDAWSCPSCGSTWPLMTKKEKNLVLFGFSIFCFLLGVPLAVWIFKGFFYAVVTFFVCSVLSVPMFIGLKIYEKFF